VVKKPAIILAATGLDDGLPSAESLLVDAGTYSGATRNGQTITKTFNGNKKASMEAVLTTPLADEMLAHHWLSSTYNESK
jgi:hypothetical protein